MSKVMLFFLQVLVNDNRINQQEQQYVQYLGSRLGLQDQAINDFIKLAYRKVNVLKAEKNLMIEVGG